MSDDTQKVTRTGLILAATLILQGLRLIIPIPPQVSLFLIGSLVNACLITAVLTIDRRAGFVVAACTPIFAWLEGMLPFFLFVFPVAAGNSVYVYCAWRWQRYGFPALAVGALIKALVLYALFYLLFAGIEFPPVLRHLLLTAMSWPQVITGVIGALLGLQLSRFLKRRHE
ncbi:hypothetical protein [uncultured Megasphaera sp.]|uniref:hypothetical protein n=1 Tax=uncultured Megasphaera sp. TaxID=165188 RepID=UPI0025F07125|nr:hypothetical protein [uncultured Megasphaera sp.]